MNDTNIAKNSTHIQHDCGIAAQSILLGATEQGFGGCMLGAVDRDKLRAGLNIPKAYEILLALALGKPKETVVLDEIKENETKYWRDENDIHHVPKRSLGEVII